MARGEVELGRQQEVSVVSRRRTMLSNQSSQLPKLVVELAQGCVARVRIPPPLNPASCYDVEPHHNEENGPMGRVCTSACSCDTLYSSSSGGSSIGMCGLNPASAAVDSGFSDEECFGSGCQTPSNCSPKSPKTPVAKINPDPRLLSAPKALCRSTSDSSSTSGCESPVPRAFLHDDDQDNSSGGSSGGGSFLYSGITCTSVHDLQILSRTETRLQQCGFYYSNLTMAEAKKKLKGQAVGTFVLRDSSHSGFLYTLSTKTMRGTTSVRIAYNNGHFRLDCDEEFASYMPRFDCILRLIQYYISASKRRSSKCVWIESSGRKDTPVILSTPLIENVLSLKHLIRKAVHKVVPNDKLEQLPVNAEHLQYLMEYPFHV